VAAQSGSASVLVFLDKNRNGLADKREPPIEKIPLTINGSRSEIKTDSRGVAFIPELPARQPTDLGISFKDVTDPHMKPSVSGTRFYSRPGKNALIQLPMMAIGEIDGIVMKQIGGKLEPIRSLPIQLLDGERNIRYRTKTDREGFYLLDTIPAGTYWVRPSPSYLKAKGLTAKPPSRRVVIATEGSFETGIDFTVMPK